MTHTATRLITLLMLLQRQPNQKAAELAGRLGISVRTLHRYIAMLEEMGIPVYSERGPYGGFSLVRGYRMPPLAFTPEEAVAVYLGASLVGEMWGELYEEAAQGALAKLDNVLPDEQRQEAAWAQRSLVATGMLRGDFSRLAPYLEKLRRGLREHRQVRMLYRSSSHPQPLERLIDPYALVYRWGWWYVIGYCHLRQALRSFRVDRIASLELLSQVFQQPLDFDLRAYLAQEQQAQPQVQARLHFAPDTAHLALGNPFSWQALNIQADGSVIVTLNAPDLSWVVSTALAFGPGVTILEPSAAIELIRQWTQAIIYQYPT